MTLWKSFTLLHQPPGCSSSPPASWLTLLYNILREWLKSPSHFLRWTWWPPPGGSEDSLEQGLKFTWSHLVSFSASVEVTDSENLLLGCHAVSTHPQITLNLSSMLSLFPQSTQTQEQEVCCRLSVKVWGEGEALQHKMATWQVRFGHQTSLS